MLAGGAVVTREHPTRGIEVVVIHRQRYGDWTLPKGKLEPGEALPVCAVREVREETGVTIRLGVPLDTIRYEAGKAGLKKVDYWGGTVLEVVRRAPDAEVDVVSWLPVRAALARLTYSHDHFLVQQYLEQPATTPVIIVRHAKAMDRKDWSRKDPARPLNTRGRRQARMLVPMLEAYGITRLVSSTSTRCLSTLLPYAHHRESSHRVLQPADRGGRQRRREGRRQAGRADPDGRAGRQPAHRHLCPPARPAAHPRRLGDRSRPPWSPASSWSPT